MSFSRAKINRNEKSKIPGRQPPLFSKASGSLLPLRAASASRSSRPQIPDSGSSSRPRSCDSEIKRSSEDDTLKPATSADLEIMENPSESIVSSIFEYDEISTKKEDSESLEQEIKPSYDHQPLTSVGSKFSCTRQNSSSGIPIRVKPSNTKTATPAPISRANSNASAMQKKSVNAIKAKNQSDVKPITSVTRRSLELTFMTKKKKLEQLKKELSERQKPIMEIYQDLIKLKKKLAESGKTITLDDMKFIDCNAKKDEPDLSAGGEDCKSSHQELDPAKVQEMQDTIRKIPLSLLDICTEMMTKRKPIMDTLEKLHQGSINKNILLKSLECFRNDSAELEQLMETTFDEQDKNVNKLIQDWKTLLESSGLSADKFIDALQKKLTEREHDLEKTRDELHESQLKTAATLFTNEEFAKAEVTIGRLKERIKNLESDITSERNLLQDQNDKLAGAYENKLQSVKNRMKEVENRKHDTESKLMEVQKSLKASVEQLKTREKSWERERQEFIKFSKRDKQLLDKFTRDRSQLETRVKTLTELSDENEKKSAQIQQKLEEDVERARKEAEEAVALRESTDMKYESVKEQLVKLQVRHQQAVDLVNTRREFEPNDNENLNTEREAELYTELLATRVALKAAEDKISNYSREKLRFIDSIERLNADTEKNKVSIAVALVKKEEEITQLENELRKSETIICNQNVEIANFTANVENLRLRLDAASGDSEKMPLRENDVNGILREANIKLDQALQQSLENEQKVIIYEHDLNNRMKQINEMENLLKVRDGLIGMLKTKKDELIMENESLTSYSNEIRELLLQAKDELDCKHELVLDLTGTLDAKIRECQQLIRQVTELNSRLASTNEKRYKLQDTVSVMEKELQTSKALNHQVGPEVQTRYALGIPPVTKLARKSHKPRESPMLPSRPPSCPNSGDRDTNLEWIDDPKKNTNLKYQSPDQLNAFARPPVSISTKTNKKRREIPQKHNTVPISQSCTRPVNFPLEENSNVEGQNYLYSALGTANCKVLQQRCRSPQRSHRHKMPKKMLIKSGSDSSIPVKFEAASKYTVRKSDRATQSTHSSCTQTTTPVKEFIDHANNISVHLKQHDELSGIGTIDLSSSEISGTELNSSCRSDGYTPVKIVITLQ